MSDLVCKLELELVEGLKRRGATRRRSAEAEHREILRAALAPTMSGKQLFEILRRGEPFDTDFDPATWRLDDRGEPADL